MNHIKFDINFTYGNEHKITISNTQKQIAYLAVVRRS